MEHNFDLAAANLQIIIELRKEILRIIIFFVSFIKEMENRTFLSTILLRLQLLKRIKAYKMKEAYHEFHDTLLD